MHIDLRSLIELRAENRVLDDYDHDRVNSESFFYCLSVVVVPIFKFLCTNLKQG